MSDIKLLCLEKKDMLEFDSNDKELACPVECKYFNACADAFNNKKYEINKSIKKPIRPPKAPKTVSDPSLYDNLPPENLRGDVENVDETGFQQSMEEDFIVEARKLNDPDETPAEATPKQKEVNSKPAKQKEVKPKTPKEPKPKKPSKPKNSRRAASLDDIEL